MPAKTQGRNLKPGTKFGEVTEMKYVPLATVAKGQILRQNGSTGGYLKMELADASTTAEAQRSLWLAIGPCRIDPNNANFPKGACVTRGVAVGTLDTSGGAVGDPVYLSDAAGTPSLSAGTSTRIIGEVTVVGAALADSEWYFDNSRGAQDVT